MKYSIHNHIRVFYDNENDQKGVKSVEQNDSVKKITEGLRKEEKDRMIKYADQMINAALAKPDKISAIAEFTRWRSICTTAIQDAEKNRPGKPKQMEKWNAMFDTILWRITNTTIYDPITKVRKSDITNWVSDLRKTIEGDLNKMPVISPSPTGKAERIKQNQDIAEWKKNNPIAKYTSDLLDYTKKHPVAIKKLLEKRKEELKKIPVSERNKGELAEYHAILETLERIVKLPYFEDNTGIFQGNIIHNWKQKVIFEVIATTLDKAIREKIKQDIPANYLDGIDADKKNLTGGEVNQVKEKSPEKLYDSYITGIETLQKSGKLTKENVTASIIKMESDMQPLLEKLGKSSLITSSYKNKFLQMRAIAENDILYSGWKQFFGDVGGKKNLTSYLDAAKSGQGQLGAIGEYKGEFHFYSTNVMKDNIMKKGEFGTADTMESAWDSYIKAANGDYKALIGIFGQDGLEAIAIYLGNKEFKSDLIDDTINPGFHTFIEGYLPDKQGKEKYIISGDKESLENISLGNNFPKLQAFMATHRGTLNTVDKLPRLPDGAIDGPLLIMQLLKGTDEKSFPPEKIEALKKAFIEDCNDIEAKAKAEKAEKVKSLAQKTWEGNLTSLGIDNPIITTGKDGKKKSHQYTGDIGKLTTVESEKIVALQSELQKKKTELSKDPTANSAKIQQIENLEEILTKEKKIVSSGVAKNATAKLDAQDAQKAANGDPQTRAKLASTSNSTAAVELASAYAMENAKELGQSIPTELYAAYGLSPDFMSSNDSSIINKVNQAIAKLTAKTRTHEENALLSLLQQKQYLIQTTAKAAVEFDTFRRENPDFGSTFGNIQRESAIFDEASLEKNKTQYQYINEFVNTGNSISDMTQNIAHLAPGTIVSMSDYPDLSKVGLANGSNIEKTGVTDCTIHFPQGSGIPPMEHVPIKSIVSFMSQAELYARCGLQSCIGLMPIIGRGITKATGKETNPLDPKLDVYEVKRNIQAICSILGINYDPNQSIDMLSHSIGNQFGSSSGVKTHLIRTGVLRREGGYNESIIHSRLQALRSM